MFNNRPFEKFCRSHFVNEDGNIQNLSKSRSERAQKQKLQLEIRDLISKLKALQHKLHTLYKFAEAARKNNPEEASESYREAIVVQKKIKGIKKQLRRLKSRDENRSKRNR